MSPLEPRGRGTETIDEKKIGAKNARGKTDMYNWERETNMNQNLTEPYQVLAIHPF